MTHPAFEQPVTQILDVPGIQLLRFERQLSDEEHTRFLQDSARQIEHALTTGTRRIVLIIDTENAPRASPLQRKQQAEWQDRHRRYFEQHVICGVFIASSALVRGALRAVGWIKPFPYPHKVVSTIHDAVEVARASLAEAGLPVPSQAQLQPILGLYRGAA